MSSSLRPVPSSCRPLLQHWLVAALCRQVSPDGNTGQHRYFPFTNPKSTTASSSPFVESSLPLQALDHDQYLNARTSRASARSSLGYSGHLETIGAFPAPAGGR